ncbi:flagellar export protein FliJ [Buttiauxella warmboldiae]|uniref:Flagellar FliJ protein n=1 Tax=Buttiauxella warmboldiae TaxID=82993 RepID=A0A3N5EEB9_9ENTR|nr:flagellar export protein FliJ [Buttiauxella warmboldiae]RPH29462.1 flagellar export protein FliJ [Buttiauxella warmboldiae]
MPKTISTLEQLVQIRARTVKDLSGKLSSQKQMCQRYENNIQALNNLAVTPASPGNTHAAMMTNQAQYKKNIQRIINWQKQEQALADMKMQEIQQNLLHEARRERGYQLVLEQRRDKFADEATRKEQKTTDAMSTQSWMRRQRQR